VAARALVRSYAEAAKLDPGALGGLLARAADDRDPGVRIKDVAKDFGISESCLTNWLSTAEVEDGVSSPATGSPSR